jgi:hypothetical protein
MDTPLSKIKIENPKIYNIYNAIITKNKNDLLKYCHIERLHTAHKNINKTLDEFIEYIATLEHDHISIVCACICKDN